MLSSPFNSDDSELRRVLKESGVRADVEVFKPVPSIYVVIPALNEAQSIGEVLQKTEHALRSTEHEVVVVDGPSTDETTRVAGRFGAVVLREKAHGYGAAYLTGFEHALSTGENSIVVMMDADSTYDPNEIPSLIEPILEGRADLVLSNRFGHMESHAMSLRNRLGNRLISKLVSRMYRMHIHDSQTGFRAVSSKILRRMFLEANGMPFATEMLIEAQKAGARVLEVPGRYRRRVGESKIRPIRDGYGIIWTAIRLCSEFNPFLIYGTLAALFFIIGIATGSYAFLGWYQWEFLSKPTWPRLGSALLSVLFLVGGTVIFTLGILLDTLLRSLRATNYRNREDRMLAKQLPQ